jgi:AraC-like DNA-binding protein
MPVVRWFDDGLLSVSDWHCAGDALGLGPAECAPTCEVSVGRVGSHAIRVVEGETVVERTQLLCLHAGEVFRPVRRVRGLERRTRIALTMESMRALLRDPRDREPRFRARTVPLTAAAVLAHHELLRHVQADSRDELAIHALALELVGHACRVAPVRAATLTPALRDALGAVQELLVRRHAERWTLPALAARVGLSPWHLSRSFRAHLGLGLHQYRVRLRLLSALDRLYDTRMPDLARIALEVGFCSHSHFTREFRAFFGVPPSRIGAGASEPSRPGPHAPPRSGRRSPSTRPRVQPSPRRAG